MIFTERPELHLNMFLKVGLGPENAKVYKSFFGDSGWQYFRECAKWQEPSVGLDTVNNEFLNIFGARHGLRGADMKQLEDHWHRQRNSSRHVIETMIAAVGPHREEVLKPLQNLKSIADPAEMIRFLATPTLLEGESSPNGRKGVSLKLKQQVARHLILAELCGEFNAHSGNGQLEKKLGEINTYFEDHLFTYSTNEGESRSNVRYSHHDPETNKLLYFGIESDPDDPAHLVYEHSLRTRIVNGFKGFDVYFSYREKDLTQAVIKALAKSQLQGGKIETIDHVQDMAGLLIALLDGQNRNVKGVLRKLVGTLGEFVKDRNESLPEDFEVQEDNQVGSDRSQSGAVQFERVNVKLPHFNGTNLEIMGYLYPNLVASYREIGRINPETGIYDGQAHELYELRRANSVVRFFWPENIYPDVDLEYEMQQRSHEIGVKLRTFGLVRGKVMI